jgi:hypothetical protein
MPILKLERGDIMAKHEADLASVSKRLDKMERQNRLMKCALAAGLLFAGAATLMGGQQKAKTGEPENFVLRDEKGTERLWLGMAKDGPVLRFRDEGGKESLWLGVTKHTPGLVLFDAQGKRSASLSTGKGGVSLVFYDNNGKNHAWLTIGENGPALHYMGGRGEGLHSGINVERDGIALWYHDRGGRVQTAGNSFRQEAGFVPRNEVVDPLFHGPN